MTFYHHFKSFCAVWNQLNHSELNSSDFIWNRISLKKYKAIPHLWFVSYEVSKYAKNVCLFATTNFDFLGSFISRSKLRIFNKSCNIFFDLVSIYYISLFQVNIFIIIAIKVSEMSKNSDFCCFLLIQGKSNPGGNRPIF